jgi:hypothetical protein
MFNEVSTLVDEVLNDLLTQGVIFTFFGLSIPMNESMTNHDCRQRVDDVKTAGSRKPWSIDGSLLEVLKT